MKDRKDAGQRILDAIGILLRGLGVAGGWFLGEVESTLQLFSTVPPMFGDLVLAVFFLLAYLFLGEGRENLIAFAGTELAIPFILGLFYSVLNTVWVARCRFQNGGWGWYYSLLKASVFPAGLAWAIFSNRAFQQFIGWGDPARTLQFCVFLVWGVVAANAAAVRIAARVTKK